MSKKSQGMPINVMIIAILALIVLIILAVMFSKKSGEFATGLDSCFTKQGKCQESCNAANNEVEISGKCPNEEEPKCCMKILK